MSDERYSADLDSLLRWTLRDLVPEQEPPGRAWRAIRAQIRANRELRRDRLWDPRQPATSIARRPRLEEEETLLHLRMLVRI